MEINYENLNYFFIKLKRNCHVLFHSKFTFYITLRHFGKPRIQLADIAPPAFFCCRNGFARHILCRTLAYSCSKGVPKFDLDTFMT